MELALITHVFSQIYLHLNWHVIHDQPILHGPIELYVHNYIRNRCRQTRGVFFEEIGGTDTHIHLALRCEPFVLPSQLIGELKGSASSEANTHFKRNLIEWQRGYGVASFSKRQLPWIRAYIQNQRKHYAARSTNDNLERHGEFEIPQEQHLKAGSKPAKFESTGDHPC